MCNSRYFTYFVREQKPSQAGAKTNGNSRTYFLPVLSNSNFNECNKNIDVLKIGVVTVGISQYLTTAYNINHYLKCLGENFVPISSQDFIY